jgi:hypothetical protein
VDAAPREGLHHAAGGVAALHRGPVEGDVVRLGEVDLLEVGLHVRAQLRHDAIAADPVGDRGAHEGGRLLERARREHDRHAARRDAELREDELEVAPWSSPTMVSRRGSTLR